jgi:hypothetical protein
MLLRVRHRNRRGLVGQPRGPARRGFAGHVPPSRPARWRSVPLPRWTGCPRGMERSRTRRRHPAARPHRAFSLSIRHLGASTTDTSRNGHSPLIPRLAEAFYTRSHSLPTRLDPQASNGTMQAGVIARRTGGSPRRSAAIAFAVAPSPPPAPPRRRGTGPPQTPGPAPHRRAPGSRPRPERPSSSRTR